MAFLRIVGLVLIVLFWSCEDDDAGGLDLPPPRALSEVAAENDAEIRAYLQTHFYNYEEFQNPPADFDFKIDLDTIAGENADKTPLIDQMTPFTINVSPDTFGDNVPDEGDVPHTYYFLDARPGGGESPTVADSTYFSYEGLLLNGNAFETRDTYTWQYLPGFLRGFSNGIANLNAGSNIVVNNDGTTFIENTGIGMVVFPSGLGYFNQTQSAIDAYSPLIFKLELALFSKDTDFDQDGIPSIQEDLNGDGNVDNDNSDEDFFTNQFGQRFPLNDHEDPDDDNDGTPTREEIDIDADGNVTFRDTDGDGTPDHLDPDS